MDVALQNQNKFDHPFSSLLMCTRPDLILATGAPSPMRTDAERVPNERPHDGAGCAVLKRRRSHAFQPCRQTARKSLQQIERGGRRQLRSGSSQIASPSAAWGGSAARQNEQCG
eukprot:353299-Chlamydomonas_euryale.AAC.13